jgi:hypothetical protein
MPKPKDKKNKNEESGLNIKEERSSLSEFVKRSLPTIEEVEKFDEYAREEVKSGDIEESLSEIYQDDGGKMVDVKKLDIKKGRGFFFYFFSLVIAGLLVSAAYAGYILYTKNNPASVQVEFAISGEESVLAGEEFLYTMSYKNLSNVDINSIEIKLTYPENFIYLDSSPAAPEKNNSWRFAKLEAHGSDEIKIKGKIIGPMGGRSNILGVITYTPANFSSEFKKETAFENTVSGTGINITIEPLASVLVGEENELAVKYKKDSESFLNKFRLSVVKSDNVEFMEGTTTPGMREINEAGDKEQEIRIKFKVKDKINEKEELTFNFEASDDGNKYFKFYEGKLDFEVIKNSLNLSLILNGSRSDQGIDFNETLNYSIAYANKGEAEMKDIVIMAVLTSDILDWKTLSDKTNGKLGDSAITWSKEQIPQLAGLEPNEEGIIDFSINVLPIEQINLNLSSKYQVESYAQFSIGSSEVKQNGDTKSNTIVSKVNSDLKLNEQVRYFNDDNIAVGSGPLPSKVGQTTSYKVYWKLTNNLHELLNVRLEAKLPEYVSWDDKNRTTVGSIYFDEANRKVVWDIGRLPVSVFEADGEFNISITPVESDRNKVLVILPGTTIEAADSETGSAISRAGKAKTTKLEDDDIAEGDGRVE